MINRRGGKAVATNVERDEYSGILAEGPQVTVAKRGTTATITLRGEWDLAMRAAADQAIREALADQPALVLLDLSQLSFIDSTGIQATVALAQRSAAQNTRLAIVRGPRAVQRVFEVCQLTEQLPFIDHSGG
jgi:anti-anti-sigma factor